MDRLPTAGAVLLGLALGSAPFLRYSLGGAHGPAHTNHEARHGGLLLMVGDHHLELVRLGGAIEIYTSDAHRRPIRPVGGSVSFDGGEAQTLAWNGYRLVGADVPQARTARCNLDLREGERLEIELPLPTP